MEEKNLCSGTCREVYKRIYWIIIATAFIIYLLILHDNAAPPDEQLGWLCGVICIGIFYVIHLYLFGNTITVTDKRVYGKTSFGKRVDLPLDKIASVSCSGMGSIGVSTSSGLIKFNFIDNSEELHHTITTLIMDKN